jgi:hypothetical protein
MPKPDFRGLGAVAEATGVWLFLGSENGRRPNFPHGDASTAGSAQRAIGPRSSGEAQSGLSSSPTGGAASSGFCRSARSVRVGPGGRPRRLSIISIDVAFRCDAHGSPPRRLRESRRPRKNRCLRPPAGARAPAPGEERPVAPERDAPVAARRHPNAGKARSGMDILHPTPKFGSGRIFTPRRRSRSRGRETFGHAMELTTARRRAGRPPGTSRRWCRAVALLWRGAPVSDPE